MRSVVYHRLLVPYPHALSSSYLSPCEAIRNQNALFYQNTVFVPEGLSVAVVVVVGAQLCTDASSAVPAVMRQS
jgi:hypothetical protein